LSILKEIEKIDIIERVVDTPCPSLVHAFMWFKWNSL